MRAFLIEMIFIEILISPTEISPMVSLHYISYVFIFFVAYVKRIRVQ